MGNSDVEGVPGFYSTYGGFFTGDINFDNTGDPGYDTYTVNAPNGGSNTTVLTESPYTAGAISVTVNGMPQTANLQNVSEVDINDGSGGDAVSIYGGGNDNSGLQQVKVNGGAGNDSLDVDSSSGLASFPGGILFNGGAGRNSLEFTQTVSTVLNPLPNNSTQTSDVYSVGPNAGEGTSVITGASGTQTVDFQNLTPVYDDVPATNATVNGTNAANAINYIEGLPAPVAVSTTSGLGVSPIQITTAVPTDFVAGDTVEITGVAGNTAANGTFIILSVIDSTDFTLETINGSSTTGNGTYSGGGTVTDVTPNTNWGQVTVDNQEAYNFTAKDNLYINGLAGSDEIHLNNPNAPAGSASGTTLSNIYVNGDDPTAGSDTLIVNATTNIDFSPTTIDSGTITGVGPVPVTFATIEHVTINGQGGNFDLTVTGPNFGNMFTYDPGSAIDSGSVYISTEIGLGSLVPMNFVNLGSSGEVTFTDADVGTFGRSDELIYNGLPNTNNTFFLDLFNAVTGDVFLNNQVDVLTPSIASLTLNGLTGNSVFDVPGGTPYTTLFLNGGSTSNSDVANLSNESATAADVLITPDILNVTQQDIIGLAGPEILTTGMTLINYLGGLSSLGAPEDTLTVDKGPKDGFITVVGSQAAADDDLVTSSSLPPIDFGNLNTFIADTDGGTNTVTFQTSFLTGALPANYQVEANPSDTLVIEGQQGANDNYTVSKPAAGSAAILDNNSSNKGVTVTETTGNLGRLQIDTQGANNLVTVDSTNESTNGPITVPIDYDGGSGVNALAMVGGTATADVYTPGAQLGAGTDTLTFPAGTESVQFQNLSPFWEDVAGPLTVNGTNADNAINYTEGLARPLTISGVTGAGVSPIVITTAVANSFAVGDTVKISGVGGNTAANGTFTIAAVDSALNEITLAGTTGNGTYTSGGTVTDLTPNANWGQVSVDGFEPIEFTNKTTLTINALAGSDEINLNNPNKPTGLTGITVNGNDPTASDTLIANGTTTVDYAPTTVGAGTITGAGPVPIAFATIEQVTINLNDNNLTYTSPANGGAGSTMIATPASTNEAGTVTGHRNDDNGLLVPLTFTNLGTMAVTFATANPGRTDTLEVIGAPANDVFDVTGPTSEVTIDVNTSLTNDLPIFATAINNLQLDGLGGNDTFTLAGGLPFANTEIQGDATTNLSGATGPVTVQLADSVLDTETSITGYGGLVTLSGVDIANLALGGKTLTVDGASESETITYDPTGPKAGTFALAGLNTTFNFTGATGAAAGFMINGGSLGVPGLENVVDQLIVQGTDSRDLFEIDQGKRIATVLAYNADVLQPVTLGLDIQTLTAQGIQGEDTFQVIPAIGTAAFSGDPGPFLNNLLINVEGSDQSATNALVVGSAFAALGSAMAPLSATEFAVVNQSLTPNAGTVRVFNLGTTQFPDIDYQNIATVSPQVAGTNLNPNLLVMGPDSYDPNNSLGTATFLGSGPTLQIQNAAIFPNNNENPGAPADQDYYRVVAQTTGTLDFQVYFNVYSTTLLPAGGELDLQVFDSAGNMIASAPGTFGAQGATANARVRIPAVAGQSYYLRVYGATGAVVNGYNATIINTAPPVPYDLELSRSVLTATVTGGGVGYMSAPAVTITGGGGAGAVGTAIIANGQVTAITISEGTGYTSAPTITLTGGGFTTAATAVAAITDTGDEPANAANDDSGRSQFDNVTNVNEPTIYIRVADGGLLNDLPGNGTTDAPPAGVIPIPYSPSETTAGFRVAIFDGTNTQTQVNSPLGYATPVAFGITTATESGTTVTITTATPNGFAAFSNGDEVAISGVSVAGYNGAFTIANVTPTSFTYTAAAGLTTPASGGTVAFPGLYQYTFTSPLADGVHNLVAEVQMIDPAKATETGFGVKARRCSSLSTR